MNSSSGIFLPSFLLARMIDQVVDVMQSRPADFVVGDKGNEYLKRWYIEPRNPHSNVYAHQFCRSDDDRAHHDHPWESVSICLRGQYIEHVIAEGGVHHRFARWPGSVVYRPASHAHRIEIDNSNGIDLPITLFMTGPVTREWGFHCKGGWIPHEQFTNNNAGCGEPEHTEFWYAVKCPAHGRLPLTEEQYGAQLDDPYRPWFCPKCERPSQFDGDIEK